VVVFKLRAVPSCAEGTRGPGPASRGLADYSQVDMLGVQYTSVNFSNDYGVVGDDMLGVQYKSVIFGAGKSPGSPNW